MNSPRAIERTVDKFWTSAAARAVRPAHAATPSSARRAEEAIAAFRELGDVIVKPLFGSMGLGMVRVSDEEMAFRVFRTIEQIRGVYYLQRTIEHEGRDIRAFVVGGRVLAAIERALGRLAHQPGARRHGAADRAARRAGPRWRCGPPRRSARSMPASTCCRRATGPSTCSR